MPGLGRRRLHAPGRGAEAVPDPAPGRGGEERRVVANFWQIFGKISAKFRSFSAVSAPIFARKYAFCIIFQNLPDSRAEIFEIWQILQDLQIFAEFSKKLLIFQTDFLLKF